MLLPLSAFELHAETPADSVYRWERETAHASGEWVSYGNEDSAKIERAYRLDELQAPLLLKKSDGTVWIIDIRALTYEELQGDGGDSEQAPRPTLKIRQVRRKQMALESAVFPEDADCDAQKALVLKHIGEVGVENVNAGILYGAFILNSCRNACASLQLGSATLDSEDMGRAFIDWEPEAIRGYAYLHDRVEDGESVVLKNGDTMSNAQLHDKALHCCSLCDSVAWFQLSQSKRLEKSTTRLYRRNAFDLAGGAAGVHNYSDLLADAMFSKSTQEQMSVLQSYLPMLLAEES